MKPTPEQIQRAGGMTRDEAMKVWREADRAGEDAYVDAIQAGAVTADDAHKAGSLAAATVIQQAFAERDGEMFGGTLNDDLRFILGQPSFTFIRHAQIWRAAGHNLPHRAEDEQAFFIGRMLHHYLTVPSEWHDSWADEIEAVQNEARQALAAKGDSRG